MGFYHTGLKNVQTDKIGETLIFYALRLLKPCFSEFEDIVLRILRILSSKFIG